jgi:hypothetical protein
MRLLLAAAIALSVSGAAADGIDEGPPVRRVQSTSVDQARYCVSCMGLMGLPWGGLSKNYLEELPWGGVGDDCPPERVAPRRVVLRTRG